MTFLIQQTMIYAVPLMIVALAGVFAERSGIINLALEGIMVFGAFIGVLFVRILQATGCFDAAKAAGDWMALQGYMFLSMLVAAALGAVFSLLPILPFAQLHRNGENCIAGCNACANRCPVSLKLDGESLRSGECIACEACVGTCPRSNISRWDLSLCNNFWLPLLAKTALFFGMGVCLRFCRFF